MWTNCVIGALSDHDIGGADVAPSHARAGEPLSAAQIEIWNRFVLALVVLSQGSSYSGRRYEA